MGEIFKPLLSGTTPSPPRTKEIKALTSLSVTRVLKHWDLGVRGFNIVRVARSENFVHLLYVCVYVSKPLDARICIYIYILYYVLCICMCLILISCRSVPERHQLHTKVLSSSGVPSGSTAQDGFTERRTRMERTCDGPTKGSHRARLLQIFANSSYFEQNEFVRTPWLWSMLILMYIYI